MPPHYTEKSPVTPILFQLIFSLPLSGRSSTPNANPKYCSKAWSVPRNLSHILCGTPLICRFSSYAFNLHSQLRVPLKSFLLNFCQFASTLQPVSDFQLRGFRALVFSKTFGIFREETIYPCILLKVLVFVLTGWQYILGVGPLA